MAQADEKRQHLRFPVVLPIDFGKADHYLSSMCVNVSQNGLLVETSQRFNTGERVCLFISFPNQTDPVKLIGEVMWVTAQSDKKDIHDNHLNEIGIRFLGSNREGEELLKGFLHGGDKANRFFFTMQEKYLVI